MSSFPGHSIHRAMIEIIIRKLPTMRVFCQSAYWHRSQHVFCFCFCFKGLYLNIQNNYSPWCREQMFCITQRTVTLDANPRWILGFHFTFKQHQRFKLVNGWKEIWVMMWAWVTLALHEHAHIDIHTNLVLQNNTGTIYIEKNVFKNII